MAHVKGSYPRLIKAPGYHIVSRFDLHALRHKLHGEGHAHAEFDLPLTSMIDMFSMLVIFLLMNFSSTGEVFFVPTKELTMPNAKHGRQLETAPLVSIFGNTIRLDAEKVGDFPLSMQDTGDEFYQLRARLKQIRSIDEASHPGQPFKGQINIQADQNAPLLHVKKIMNVLIAEGWTAINFAVRPESGSDERTPANQ